MAEIEKTGSPVAVGDDNLGIDYVIIYRIPEKPQEKLEAEASYATLINLLYKASLHATARRPATDPTSLYIFLRASPTLLTSESTRARLSDWLHGIRTSAPSATHTDPISPAERLRLVHRLLVKPKTEGGAGITPGQGQWRFVEALFPLHDHALNRRWLARFSTRYLLTAEDLDEIRDELGEGVAYYFEFIQTYFVFMIVPAVLGVFAWAILGSFSWAYTLGLSIWSVVFIEYWKQKEVDLAVRWGTRGVSRIQVDRAAFKHDFETIDAVTGEPIKVYSPFKRLGFQFLQVPFALACVVALGGAIAMCNSLEIFINEVYDGPFKTYLGLLPTILLSALTPTFSAILTAVAHKLTALENYQTEHAHSAALIQKEFVLNFLSSYMAAFFTSFVYTPFGHVIAPFLIFWHQAANTITMGQYTSKAEVFHVDPNRIANQMFFFTITAQIVSLATEVVVPYVKRKVLHRVKKLKADKADLVTSSETGEDAEIIKRVTAEAELDVYDVNVDYREMVIQYGYLALFSVAWPLAGLCFLVNNWVELRSDALKIAIGSRRPIPFRTDSIGPWINALGFLSWLGSITSAGIVYLCGGALRSEPRAIPIYGTTNSTKSEDGFTSIAENTSPFTAWAFLIVVLAAEHLYLLTQLLARYMLTKLDSPGLQMERKERFEMKKKMLASMNQELTTAEPTGPIVVTKKEAFFWNRFGGEEGVIEGGRALIRGEDLKQKSNEVTEKTEL